MASYPIISALIYKQHCMAHKIIQVVKSSVWK